MPRMSTGGNGTATDLKANYKQRPPKLVNTEYKSPIFMGFARRMHGFSPYGVFDRWKSLFPPPTKYV